MKFVSSLLTQHLQRYPRMQLPDIYKLLHQAALGSGHAVTDAVAARDALKREFEALGEGPAPGEPLIDVISPDGKLARVHLRAYRAAGRDVDKLAQAFIETARIREPQREKLERFCACLGDFADTGEIPFAAADVRDYVAQIVAGGYPVVHHSDAYRAAYRPAYRIVQIDLLPL